LKNTILHKAINFANNFLYQEYSEPEIDYRSSVDVLTALEESELGSSTPYFLYRNYINKKAKLKVNSRMEPL
jgi:hypothetical protein